MFTRKQTKQNVSNSQKNAKHLCSQIKCDKVPKSQDKVPNFRRFGIIEYNENGDLVVTTASVYAQEYSKRKLSGFQKKFTIEQTGAITRKTKCHHRRSCSNLVTRIWR